MFTKIIDKLITKLSKNIRFLNSQQLHSPPKRLEYDVVIVGGGVAGLSTAIRLKDKEKQSGRPISVCVLEKGAEIGDHIFSGNCFETKAFDQLFPNWRQMKQNRPPIETQITSDNFYILYGKDKSIKIPHFLYPKVATNEGNYVISLSRVVRWMGQRAAQMGVDILTGTPASNILYHEKGHVMGVVTQDFGVSKKGQLKDNFVPGLQIVGKQTVFAQGPRGSLTEKVIQKYNLREKSDPQVYSLGLKQIWQVDQGHKLFQPGYVQHTLGWPLCTTNYTGSFLYHMKPNLVIVGLAYGLDYQNPYTNPYEQFQKLKTHPQIRKFIEGGKCIQYGAKALNSGGYFSIPKLIFPGGMLVGCSAGFVNLMKVKGVHTAIKSGLEAANAVFKKLTDPNNFIKEEQNIVHQYQKNMEKSWVWDQLYAARNVKGAFKNIFTGLMYGGLYKFIEGREPLNLRNTKPDSQQTKPALNYKKIQYPKHDNKLTFDVEENLIRSGTSHEVDQPSHLVVRPNKTTSPLKSLEVYQAPEEKFCPANVFKFVSDKKGNHKLEIQAEKCIHCKICEVKMVDEYIEWRVPQGNGGPKFNLM